MPRNSAEYRTLIQLTADIQLALKDHLTAIGGELVASELITPGQYQIITNPSNPADERVVKLVGYIQTNVEENPQDYHTFIGVLEKDLAQYGNILKKLKEKYDSLRTGGAGQSPAVSPAAAAGGGQTGGMSQ